MKLQTIVSMGLGGLLAAATWAAEPAKDKRAPAKDQQPAKQLPAPGQQSGLPPGHPPLPSSQGQPQLPAGHPQVPGQPGGGGGASLPPGHPALPPGAGRPGPSDPSLPPGHPALPQGHPEVPRNAKPAQPKGPPATVGSLFVRAYQATEGGAAIGEEPVSVELHHQGQVIQRMEGTLDKSGTVLFTKLPLGRRFQPVVKVLRNGVEFQAVGEAMDGYHSGQQIDLPVYETTDKEPAWSVYLRHVIVEPTPQGARVTEMVSLNNPVDRAWVGAARSAGKRQTSVFELPAGADEFRFGGGGKESVRIENGRLVNTAPLMPGVSQIQFAYTVPPGQDGKVRVKIVAPRAVQNMMVFVADVGTPVSVEGLQSSGAHDMGPQGKALMYGSNDQKPGQVATVTVVSPAPKKQQADAGAAEGAAGGGSSTVAKAVAGVGGGVGLVVGVGYVLLKAPAKANAA